MNGLREFNFSVLSSHRDPMTRQIEEAVRIANGLDLNRHTDKRGLEVTVNCLNRKEETFAPQIGFDQDKNQRTNP